MLNQVILVGTAMNVLDAQHQENGRLKLFFDLMISKFDDLENPDTSIITLSVEDDMALVCSEFLKFGATVGIKGYITATDNVISVKVDKLTFLSTTEDNDN